VPILWENKWIVSVPHWYGDIPANWNYLDFEIYQDFKNNYEEGDNIDYSMFMRKVEITKEEVKKESWWVRFKKWFKNLFK
jgi:hypothetical protein